MASSGWVWDHPTGVCVHKVALERMPDPEDFERGARELLGAMDLRPDRPVLIKPNLVMDMAPDSGIVTHPAFVGGMVDHLLAVGLREEEIVIAEGKKSDSCKKNSGLPTEVLNGFFLTGRRGGIIFMGGGDAL